MKIKKLEQHLTKFTNGRVIYYTHSYEINSIGNPEGEYIAYHKSIPEHIEELFKNNSNPKLFILNWNTIESHKYLRNASTQN